MKFDFFECVSKHQLQAFSHIATIGERRSNIITKISTAKGTKKDLVQVNRPNDRVILGAADKKTSSLRPPDAGQISKKLFVRFGRRCKPTMKRCTASIQRHDFSCISLNGRTQIYSVTMHWSCKSHPQLRVRTRPLHASRDLLPWSRC